MKLRSKIFSFHGVKVYILFFEQKYLYFLIIAITMIKIDNIKVSPSN